MLIDRATAKRFPFVLILAACGPSTQHTAALSTLAPADAFTCAVRELTGRKYTVASADRAAGLVKAERAAGNLLAGDYMDEITVTVLPAGAGSDMRVAAQRSRVGNGGRSTNGMVAPKSVKSDAAAVSAACGGPT